MSKLARVFEAFSIKDSVSGIPAKVRDQVSNIIYDTRNDDNKVTLLSEAAVTHAGIVNANMGYYKPDKLQASVQSWLTPYTKPILVNHDKSKDPIGRVAGSIYKSTVPSLIPKIKNSVYDTDYSYRGLGHIQNLLKVTDADGVNKVLDGRYLTLSVSGDNDEMTCSICGQEWLNDGKCLHKFGQHYEDERTGDEKLAFWMAGNFLWDEVSFVNEPADPFAQVLTRELGDDKDQILQIYNYKDVTNIDKQVEDSTSRLLKLYVINDSKKGIVELNDKTDFNTLYKVYDVHLHPVNADLKLERETTTVADTKTTEQTAEAKVVDATAVAAPASDSAKDTTIVDAKAVEVKPEVKDEITQVVAAPEVKVEDVKLAIADATKPFEDKIKELEPKVKDLEATKSTLEDEKQSLTKKATELQQQVRDMRMEQVLDLKEALGMDSYATTADRKAAKDIMASRTIESIEDQVKDLTDTLKKHKRPGPANVAISDSGAQAIPSDLDRLQDTMSHMSAEQLVALKLSGRFNPSTKR